MHHFISKLITHLQDRKIMAHKLQFYTLKIYDRSRIPMNLEKRGKATPVTGRRGS
jgi:hypothetical protein